MTNEDLLKRIEAIEARLDRLEGRRVQSAGNEFKLCYVEDGVAWFTTKALSEQWGDDWNDAPYEHNAGDPYYWWDKSKEPPYQLARIRFEGLFTPADLAYSGNSYWSVEQINSGRVAWLTDEKGVNIFAGASIEEFKQLVRAAGGTIYVEETDDVPDA